jgi:Protein of unknown function (DUF2799)
MASRVIPSVIALLLAGCAIDRPDASNLGRYCAPENAYRLGSQSRAYFGVCPKEAEPAFLASLRRGRAIAPRPPQVMPYYERMDQLEKQLLAASTEAERNQVRERLRDAEWWAIHIVTSPGTYSGGGTSRD